MLKEVKSLYAYCLFCETQRCRQISEYISRNYGLLCISPVYIQRKWIKGVPTDERHDWLPGYLFLYSDEPFMSRFDVRGIIRILGNGALTGSDLKFAEMIFRKHGVMGTIPLIQEGAVCRISDPAWKEISGRVVRMDRERRRCCVEFEFDGISRSLWVGYELTDHET